MVIYGAHLTAKDEDQEERGGELRVREHDDVHEIRICGRLEEQPTGQTNEYE